MAATLHAKINRRKLDKLDIIKICEEILNPTVPMALRLSGILMGGVVIVYERKVKLLYDDATRILADALGAIESFPFSGVLIIFFPLTMKADIIADATINVDIIAVAFRVRTKVTEQFMNHTCLVNLILQTCRKIASQSHDAQNIFHFHGMFITTSSNKLASFTLHVFQQQHELTAPESRQKALPDEQLIRQKRHVGDGSHGRPRQACDEDHGEASDVSGIGVGVEVDQRGVGGIEERMDVRVVSHEEAVHSVGGGYEGRGNAGKVLAVAFDLATSGADVWKSR
ncbi:uncharacterized protein LOC109708650 [Ananas comosus]|uniref:Uncharacterized protein LOC109708650 n=1 Tax=Ananas comosus TaxID=4615 RepID=A0A6P5EY23_ANACO|nr:uncharacterized protein LOC109708650 [Ananas comosus]